MRGVISYWVTFPLNPSPHHQINTCQVLPIISGLVWLGMLLGMFLHWVITDNMRRYEPMMKGDIPFISHIGALELKPLFIVGCVLTSVFLDSSFLAERWLRHRGRLVPNGSLGEKILVGLTIFFAFVGTVGLILLSIFDTKRHNDLHNIFLALFIIGYLLSAVFICWEYQRLGVRKLPPLNRACCKLQLTFISTGYRDHRILRISFWVKLMFVLVEFALAVAFAVTQRVRARNAAAIIEWVIALIFTFYVFSFFIDLYPAIYTRDRASRFVKPGQLREMEEATDSGSPQPPHDRDYELDRNPRDF